MVETWTPAQYREYCAKQSRKKTKAIRSCCLQKHHHPSKSEASYCDWLHARLTNGELLRVKWPGSVEIRFKGRLWRKWKVDFEVTEKDGSTAYHECKGFNFSNRDYQLRRDAFLLANPKATLYVNKVLWTGKPDKKSVAWRMRDVKRVQRLSRSRVGQQRAYHQTKPQ